MPERDQQRTGPVPAEMWHRLAEFRKRTVELKKEHAEAEFVARDDKRDLAVVVGADGRLRNLMIEDAAMAKLSGDELCDLILDLYDQATARAKEQVRGDMKKIYGMPFTPDEVGDGVPVGEVLAQLRREYLGR